MRSGRIRTLPLGGTILLLASWLLATALAAQSGGLDPEAVVDLHKVTDLAYAPDGSAVAFTVQGPRAPGDEPGKAYAELWLARLDKDKVLRYTHGKEKVTKPAFTPDGKMVTFLVERRDVQAGVQLYGMRTRGGEARLLTRVPGSLEDYRWSPDGSRIALVATDPETEAEKTAAATGRDWKVWGDSPKFDRLLIQDAASGERRALYGDDLHVVRLEWSPDGETVYFQATTTGRVDDEYMASQIYAVAAAGGPPRILTVTPGKLGHMAVSPAGTQLAFLGATSANDPLAQSLFVVPAEGGRARNLTEGLEASGVDLFWQDDATLVLVAEEGEHSALWRVDVASGRRAAVAWPRLIVDHLAYDPASRRLAVAASSPAHPSELYVSGPDLAAPERLSHVNPGLDGVRLARQEVVEWTGAEGWPIRGVLTYPLDYEPGKKYPLVLQVHGGPEGVSLDGWTTTALYPVQVLAARGYVVLQPNYRGSAGRGVAFSKADHDDLGGREYDDVLAGVDALVARGLVDPQRVGTGGWSYGGYFSAWAATRHSAHFRASVVGAGLTNWIAFTGTTDIPNEMSTVHWNQWWREHPELHWQRSPLAHLDEAQTPTLIVHGEKDERVHLEQSLELYTGLRLKGVPTELVTYPREPHGLDERAHQLDYLQRVLAWFDRYLAVPEVEGETKPSL